MRPRVEHFPNIRDEASRTTREARALPIIQRKPLSHNRHIKDKIRQKLQVLRDAKLLMHVSSGVWRPA